MLILALMKFKDTTGFTSVSQFIEEYISRYNIEDIRYFSLRHSLNSNGEIKYPTRKQNSYAISIAVNTDKSFYPLTYVGWGRKPTTETKQGWITTPTTWSFDKPEHALLFTFGRFFFHYLSTTRQIKDSEGNHIKNVHANASWFGEQMLSEYRNYRTNLILE